MRRVPKRNECIVSYSGLRKSSSLKIFKINLSKKLLRKTVFNKFLIYLTKLVSFVIGFGEWENQSVLSSGFFLGSFVHQIRNETVKTTRYIPQSFCMRDFTHPQQPQHQHL